MKLSDSDVRRIADAVMSADAVYRVHKPGSTDLEAVPAALGELRRQVLAILAWTSGSSAAIVSANTIAAAVAARYPVAPDVETLAKAIVDEINTRLVRCSGRTPVSWPSGQRHRCGRHRSGSTPR